MHEACSPFSPPATSIMTAAGVSPGGTEVPPGRRSAHWGWTVRDAGSSHPLSSPGPFGGSCARSGAAGSREGPTLGQPVRRAPRGEWADPERGCRADRGRRRCRAWSPSAIVDGAIAVGVEASYDRWGWRGWMGSRSAIRRARKGRYARRINEIRCVDYRLRWRRKRLLP
jgi:hypothetical protein